MKVGDKLEIGTNHTLYAIYVVTKISDNKIYVLPLNDPDPTNESLIEIIDEKYKVYGSSDVFHIKQYKNIKLTTNLPKISDRRDFIIGIIDIEIEIMLRLNYQDIINLSKVNLSYKQLCKDQYFWRLKTIYDNPIIKTIQLEYNMRSNIELWNKIFVGIRDFEYSILIFLGNIGEEYMWFQKIDTIFSGRSISELNDLQNFLKKSEESFNNNYTLVEIKLLARYMIYSLINNQRFHGILTHSSYILKYLLYNLIGITCSDKKKKVEIAIFRNYGYTNSNGYNRYIEREEVYQNLYKPITEFIEFNDINSVMNYVKIMDVSNNIMEEIAESFQKKDNLNDTEVWIHENFKNIEKAEDPTSVNF